jgi:hydroxymethylglutaryl-CoA reductase
MQALKNEKEKVNIENFVGYVKVPVRLAGPLRIKGSEHTDNVFFASVVNKPTDSNRGW